MKKRNVHLHLHTSDGGWDESKHPRKDDGRFGTGSGGSKAEETAGSHQHVLRRIDAHYDRHNAEQRKRGGMTSPEGAAHQEAAKAFGKARAALNMNEPIAGQERFNKLMDRALELAAKADGKEYRGRESGPASGSKGEPDPVKAGGPVSKETAAANKEPAPKKQGASRAELKAQAKAEHAAANKGRGSYYKAALLYEQAGEADKAAEAHALAKRYMHDPAGIAVKREADRAAERKTREEARSAGGAEGRVLSELADAYRARAEGDPEDNALTKRISDLKDQAMSYRRGKGK